MRFAATPEFLPPDPHRDFFYNTRYADSGTVTHPNWFKTQGLYGLGMKTPDTQERLSLLLRHAWPEHDRLVEPPVVAAGPVLPGLGPAMAARRDVLQLWLVRADLRPRPDRTRPWAVSVSVLLQLGSRRLTSTAIQRMSGDRFSAASAMND